MRGWRGLVSLVLVAGLTACAEAPDHNRAGTAGRACKAVEYDVVAAALGIRFDSAQAATVEQTHSCVVTQAGRYFPDLAVALTPTTANEVIFQATATPGGASAVESLGRIAYQVGLPPVTAPDGTPSGPGLQVGWLSAAPTLVVLRYTWPADATEQEVAALSPAIIELARSIEAQVVGAPGGAAATADPSQAG